METWKSIKGYEGHFEVSSLGRVRGVDRIVHNKRYGALRVKGKVFKGGYNNSGYYTVSLSNKVAKCFLVHRLVAQHFIENPLQLPEVNHRDGDKKNNSVENLEWTTRSENAKHAFREKLNRSKKHKIIAVHRSGTIVEFASVLEAAKATGVDRRNIYNNMKGRGRYAGDYRFQKPEVRQDSG